MKKYLSVLLVACMTTFLFAGCKSTNSENAASDTSVTETTEAQAPDPDGTHTVVDHAGNTVEVPNHQNRHRPDPDPFHLHVLLRRRCSKHRRILRFL